MDFVKLLLILAITSIIPGQLIRLSLPVSSAAITITDVSSALLLIVFTIYSLAIKKSLKISKELFVPFLIFTLLALASTIFVVPIFSTGEITVSLMFLVRFMLYFSVFIVVANTVVKSQITNWLNLFLLICVVYSLVGLVQYVLLPDLTSLAALGWDPHQKRIVSTFLDPNFSGGLLTIAFAIALSLFLNLKKIVYLLTSGIFFLTLLLTFSRSSYLALIVTILAIGILKSPKILIIFLAALLISYTTIPQIKNRVTGALTLDETSQARIESWQKALAIFRNNAIFGVGFNTYRFTQAQYGFFPQDQPQGGHSGAGSDSSILLVLATTGVVGTMAYLVFLANIFKKFSKNLQKSALSLGSTAAFLGLLIHSQFVNSLFFPQITISLFFLLGLSAANDN